ncbi:hypothetical protein NDU88_005483 [Pleurodeles waltl]|uniref:Uncharacterized protein n=1 Tax=Pleurodeles waltl TaxID=8319 RepID=A0AAV7PFJ4_PLEWA|nr:hypothetical protein NDU88_005483 [Pleurodeles waltl]
MGFSARDSRAARPGLEEPKMADDNGGRVPGPSEERRAAVTARRGSAAGLELGPGVRIIWGSPVVWGCWTFYPPPPPRHPARGSGRLGRSWTGAPRGPPPIERAL